MSEFKEWVLDVTLSMPVFCPYERETDEIVTGFMMMTKECPGKFVGIIHMDGNAALEKWIAEHPDWKKTYGVEDYR
jgi:hypothetical protein